MSGNARILNSGQKTFFREHVTVANATGLHFDAHFSRTGLRNLALDELEIASGLGDLGHLHLCHLWYHRYFHRCHKSSYEFLVTFEYRCQRHVASLSFRRTRSCSLSVEIGTSRGSTQERVRANPSASHPSSAMVNSHIACVRADQDAKWTNN